MNRSSLTEDEQAALPESQEVITNGDPEPDDGLMDVEDPENSSDSDMDDIPAEDGEACAMSPNHKSQVVS